MTEQTIKNMEKASQKIQTAIVKQIDKNALFNFGATTIPRDTTGKIKAPEVYAIVTLWNDAQRKRKGENAVSRILRVARKFGQITGVLQSPPSPLVTIYCYVITVH